MQNLQHEKIKGMFLTQIPLAWIEKIQPDMGGYTICTALYIWSLKGLKKTHKDLTVTRKSMNQHFKISDRSFSRALQTLENLKMITLERHVGRSPRVTILCEQFYEKNVEEKNLKV